MRSPATAHDDNGDDAGYRQGDSGGADEHPCRNAGDGESAQQAHEQRRAAAQAGRRCDSEKAET